MHLKSSILLCAFLLTSHQIKHAFAKCECGYMINNTLYTDALETDFLHRNNIAKNLDWQIQNYTVPSELARGPYGKNASLDNVVANPLKDKNAWTGEAVKGGEAGLQLFVRAIDWGPGGLVPMAELATVRNDILYGSFRASIKVTGVSGTCGAFFWVCFPPSVIPFAPPISSLWSPHSLPH